jgi:NADH:ubiquinone oxidoreductase subunit C
VTSCLLKISQILPVIKIEFYFKQNSLYFKREILFNIVKILKYHYKYNFKMLTLICALDLPKNENRFKIIYEFLSLKFNNRIKLKILTNEIVPVYSIQKMHSGSTWWEAECWDMFGIIFVQKKNIIRLLTDYGFQGFPLRKDFPLTGFIETRYNQIKNRITYNNLELTQHFRIFFFKSPWSV